MKERRRGTVSSPGPLERWTRRVQLAAWLILNAGCLAVSPAVIWPALAVFAVSSCTAWVCVVRRWRGQV